jgi:hypothetical protein
LHLNDKCKYKKQVYCFDADTDGGPRFGENAPGVNFVTMACALHLSEWHFDLLNSLSSIDFFGLKTHLFASAGAG